MAKRKSTEMRAYDSWFRYASRHGIVGWPLPQYQQAREHYMAGFYNGASKPASKRKAVKRGSSSKN